MELLVFLILFPLVSAVILLLSKNDTARNIVVKVSVFVLFAGTIALFAVHFHDDIKCFKANSILVDRLMFFTEMALAAVILYLGIRHRRHWTYILIVAQTAVMVTFEIFFRRDIVVQDNLFVDKLSIVLAFIVGIVGGLIALYAIGYMKTFHEKTHKDVKDSRCFFFFVVFAFISAMFGIAFSNNLVWLYFFWEITTLSSFLLIGYKKTPEAIRNSFLALELNLIAGVTFALAIVYLSVTSGVVELDKLMVMGKAGVLIPVALICLSGLIKSAQLPFSSWLVGAMVAPVPVSALLHASTMVKAGVYVMLRFALILEGTFVGYVLALIGGFTFLLCSLIAVSQSEAKKVLAYSTVANLGLIVLCAGVGTYEAMWAGVLLIIFHAVAKALLFLCVGTVEEKIHSMNIEDMSGLIVSMPKTSIMMQIGMAGMFLAPFGMLISKWAALKALVDSNPLLAIFVVFGGAVTVFFWVKWMGKLITVVGVHKDLESGISRNEMAPLFTLSFLTVGVCLLFPLVCKYLVEPYLIEMYDKTVALDHGNIVIMMLMFAMVMLFPLSFINYGKKVKVIDAYLGGANVATSSTQFQGAAGSVKNMAMRNYYLEKYCGEARLLKMGLTVSIILSVAMIAVAVL